MKHSPPRTEAELIENLERIADMEDKYFPGYLGNPTALGIILPSMRRKIAARRRKPAARCRASPPRRTPAPAVR
jgi:hypothetical protein